MRVITILKSSPLAVQHVLQKTDDVRILTKQGPKLPDSRREIKSLRLAPGGLPAQSTEPFMLLVGSPPPPLMPGFGTLNSWDQPKSDTPGPHTSAGD